MDKRKNWVDYKELKASVTIEMLLDRYGLLSELKKSGQNLAGCCPIHRGSNPRQFSVNPDKNIWNCFGNCKTGGNILDFVAMMEFENKEPESVRKAALLLKQWFMFDSTTGGPDPDTKTEPVRKEVEQETAESETDTQKAINPPLTFRLKTLVREHPFFQERGILPETVKHFGLGLCTRGMMKDRIVIPIYDEQKNLVAYCGRAVNDQQIEEEGKYKLPPNFVKSAVIYNLHRQMQDPEFLIVVESYLSVYRLHQLGHPNTVAIMGSSLSEDQERGIVRFLGPSGKVLLMFDADEDGQKCTEDCLVRLSSQLFAKAVDLSEYVKKPHQLTADQLGSLFE